jgi:hypothetical protein
LLNLFDDIKNEDIARRLFAAGFFLAKKVNANNSHSYFFKLQY